MFWWLVLFRCPHVLCVCVVYLESEEIFMLHAHVDFGIPRIRQKSMLIIDVLSKGGGGGNRGMQPFEFGKKVMHVERISLCIYVVSDFCALCPSVPSSCFLLACQAKLKVTSVSYNAVIAALFQQEEYVSDRRLINRSLPPPGCGVVLFCSVLFFCRHSRRFGTNPATNRRLPWS